MQHVQVVDWTESRNFFFQRLKRRLAEESLIRQLQAAGGQEFSHSAALALIKDIFSTTSATGTREWTDDTQFLAWSKQPTGLEEHLQKLHAKHVEKELVALGSSTAALKALPQGLDALLRSVSFNQYYSFLCYLAREILNLNQKIWNGTNCDVFCWQVDASTRSQLVEELKRALDSLSN